MKKNKVIYLLIGLYIFTFISLTINLSNTIYKNYKDYSDNKKRYIKIKKEIKNKNKHYDSLNKKIPKIEKDIDNGYAIKEELQSKLKEKLKNENKEYNGIGKTIYFTFDDGPGEYTDEILNILDKYNIKATFFVTCKDSTTSFSKKMIEKGHTVGLHTCTHKYNDIYASEEAYFNDLNEVSNMVKNGIKKETKYIRFPGGSSNTVSKFNKGIMTVLVNDVTLKGYKYYDWNIDSGDAAGYDSEKEYTYTIEQLKRTAWKTNIVLMHDIKVSTKDSLERIIVTAKDMGFEFSNITDETYEIHHGVNN